MQSSRNQWSRRLRPQATVQRRLLHAGAATGDIIHQYISTIKALRQMDASGGACSI